MRKVEIDGIKQSYRGELRIKIEAKGDEEEKENYACFLDLKSYKENMFSYSAQ